MPGNSKAKAAKAPKGKKNKGKAERAIPKFATYVNPTAGLAASGVRVGFPAERTVSFNYYDYFALTGSTGSMGQYQFRLNSAYDPNYTGTGHQPLGFDQWSLFYNHYVVEECSYQVAVAPSILANVITHLSDDTTVPTSVTEMGELGAAVHLWMPYQPAHIFNGRVNMAQFFNRGSIATDSELRATISANPTEQCLLTIGVSSTDGSSTVTSIVHVKLTMRVRFMEPKDLTPSMSKAVKEDEYEFVRVKKVTGA